MNEVEIAGLSFKDQINIIGHELSKVDQVECPLTHRFSPGLYIREIFMPAGSIIIGKIHTTEHFNILMKGACLLAHEDGTKEELRAPMTFISKAGVQKVLYILEDMIWMTTHVTDETDIEKLENMLTEPVTNLLIGEL